MFSSFFYFFFFQAEDGIRDHCVTGVQTCALPICAGRDAAEEHAGAIDRYRRAARSARARDRDPRRQAALRVRDRRSEERRVGKECRSRWEPEPLKKKAVDTRGKETERGRGTKQDR